MFGLHCTNLHIALYYHPMEIKLILSYKSTHKDRRIPYHKNIASHLVNKVHQLILQNPSKACQKAPPMQSLAGQEFGWGELSESKFTRVTTSVEFITT